MYFIFSSCLERDLGVFLDFCAYSFSEPGFGGILGFMDVFQFMFLCCISCLDRDLGGFWDLWMCFSSCFYVVLIV